MIGFLERRKRPAMLGLAAGLDSLFGEPPPPAHPVVLMGKVIARADGWIKTGDPDRQGRSGAILTVSGVAGAFAAGFALEALCRRIPLGFLLHAWLLKTCLAWRALDDAALEVQRSLERNELAEAKAKLGALVSRGTASLTAPLVAAATIESVAENLGDSLSGPTIAYLLGGLGGVFAYRWVNTLDSMIGYRGEYEWAGKFAARLDDLLNIAPSRAAAAAIIAAAPTGKGGGVTVALQDAMLTESPNAGWPMAAMAGVLDRRLEKKGHYVLNPEAPDPEPADIGLAREIVRYAWVLLLIVALVIGAPKAR